MSVSLAVQRILANFAFAFFSAMTAATMAELGEPTTLKVSLISAFITGGVAGAYEWKRILEERKEKEGKKINMLLF